MPTVRGRRGDLVALGVLVVGPFLVFSIPALLGYPLLTGDNVIQNFPLRVLAGEILRHGHLPIYNPLAWGGTPLLASANASVAFPDTVAFAIFPALFAWVVVEASTFAAAAVGLYCFLRFNRLSPIPAAIGALTFGLGGFLSSQAVHLDVVQTAAALAWVLVGLDRIAHGPPKHLLAWTALLGAAVAAVGLAGNPESAYYAGIGAAIYAVSLFISAPRRLSQALHFAIATGAGALVAAIQVLPAAKFVFVSQRATVPISFLAGGSIRPSRLALLVVPHLLGGGPIGLRPYIGANLAEIDAYPGLLALVAAVVIAVRFRSFPAARVVVWYVIGAVGLLIALGPATPLPELIHHLPIVDSSRLPSRALLLVSVAFAVLVGYWSAEFLGPGSVAEPGTKSPTDVRASLTERIASLVPPGLVIALVAATLIGGAAFARIVAGREVAPWSVARVAPYLAVASVVALATGWIVWHGPKLSMRRRTVGLVAIFAIDLLTFTANQSSLAPIRTSSLDRANPYEKALARLVGPGGRFAVVDPKRDGRFVLDELGAPNLNVFTGVASVQGYGSLTWRPYASATGTHGQNVVAPAALASGVFDSLDLRALLVLPSSFESHGNSRPIALSPTRTTTRYFGGAVNVWSVCIAPTGYVPVRSMRALARRIHLFAPSRRTSTAIVELAACGAKIVFLHPVRAEGVVFPESALGIRGVIASVSTSSRRRFGLDGPLARFVTPPHWGVETTIGPYLALSDSRATPPLLVMAHGKRTAASVRVVSQSTWTPTETVAVDSATRAILVRDVSDIPGWRATIVHGDTKTTVVPERHGVVQAVPIPAGRSLVTFGYDPPGLSLGEALAAAGLALLALLIIADLLTNRRRSRRDGLLRSR